MCERVKITWGFHVHKPIYSKLLIMAVKQIALVLDLIGFIPLEQITLKGRKHSKYNKMVSQP